MATKKLVELAKTIRSKNAGVDRLTFDIIFVSRDTYEMVKRSHAITRESVARLYNIDPGRITDFVEFDPACAIKFTIRRPITSGSPGDGDIYGSQQYGPLFDIDVPVS